MPFKKIDISSFELNPFKRIGEEWFLLSAGKENDFNTMTAAWGGMGVMWNRNVFTAVIRPSRHTFKFMEENSKFSACFFGNSNRDDLKYCGSHSGRNEDKISHTSLNPVFIDGVPAFEEAKTIFICKKIYRGEIDENSFIDNSLFEYYKSDTFHVVFIGEILEILEKE
ncbi:MAG TPA: flavin reductase [Oscillospiraceae bacterium]|nr:flavin reductase [Oscillospiraceae bacterium]